MSLKVCKRGKGRGMKLKPPFVSASLWSRSASFPLCDDGYENFCLGAPRWNRGGTIGVAPGAIAVSPRGPAASSREKPKIQHNCCCYLGSIVSRTADRQSSTMWANLLFASWLLPLPLLSIFCGKSRVNKSSPVYTSPSHLIWSVLCKLDV